MRQASHSFWILFSFSILSSILFNHNVNESGIEYFKRISIEIPFRSSRMNGNDEKSIGLLHCTVACAAPASKLTTISRWKIYLSKDLHSHGSDYAEKIKMDRNWMHVNGKCRKIWMKLNIDGGKWRENSIQDIITMKRFRCGKEDKTEKLNVENNLNDISNIGAVLDWSRNEKFIVRTSAALYNHFFFSLPLRHVNISSSPLSVVSIRLKYSKRNQTTEKKKKEHRFI